ncbi:MAG: PASTA domain-containing protein [Bacteroidales bacterium]|nr:PASTA domain-containing protein [Bacteroidales bacterium]
MRIKRFISRHLLLRNIVLAILISLLALVIIFGWLRIITRHGEAFSVPDLTGYSLDEAKQELESKHLRWELFDSVYSNDHARGTVVEQHPRPDFKVKKNRKIYLTLNAMNPERILMPNLVNLTIRQAQSRLESYGLKIGKITYEPDLGINVVLAQKYQGKPVEEGDTLIKGSFIELTLGRGLSDESIRVPKLIGLTLEEATLKAADSYLRLGAIIPDPDITKEFEPIASIWRQRPEYNKNIAIPFGSSIDVWLTLDSTKIQIEMNDTIDYAEPFDTLQ